jgi:hypothetical protein
MKLLRLFALLFVPALSFAQFTTVTGTVTDPNGLAYANGTISAGLVLPGGTSPTLNGGGYTPPSQPTGLDGSGKFTMRLADNTVLLPGGTQWTFLICSFAGTIQPAGGKGPVCFNVPALTISGSSQSITSNIAAVPPPALSTNPGTGTVTSSGSPVAGNIPKFTTATNIAPAAATDIVNLFSGCSGTQSLGADGACHAAGTGTVTNTAGALASGFVAIGNAGNDLKTDTALSTNGAGAQTDTQGTITTSTPVFSHTVTWNAAGVAFSNWLSNITCTAAATASVALGIGTSGTQWQFKYGAANCGSAQLLGPAGATATPSYAFTGDATSGIWQRASGKLDFSANSGVDFEMTTATTGFLYGAASATYAWTSNAISNGLDTGLSRTAGAVIAAGNGSQGDTSGKFKAAGYMSVGTTFTSNGGCTESALTGGATAGSFTVGQNTACTIVITMGNSATAPHGWTCTAYDETGVPAVAIRQTGHAATSCSLLMTVATNDVIVFSATLGW